MLTKEQALALVREATDPGQGLNRLREYVQVLVLRSLHECEAFRPLAFVEGTVLRLLHGLPRFSEDLDFSLVSAEGYAGRVTGWRTTCRPSWRANCMRS